MTTTTRQTMQGKMLCEVFRSSRKEDMYLYVDKQQGLIEVPEPLLEHFGTPLPAMTLILSEDRKLARVSAADVMTAIREQGYYFQMPPAREDYLLDLYRAPTEARY